MIECVCIDGQTGERYVRYLSPRHIVALTDLTAEEAKLSHMIDDVSERFCDVRLVETGARVLVCHDAEQVAQAVVRSLANNAVVRPEDV
jgi:hypothetical protein